MTTQTAAARYREKVNSRLEIVDVHLPSGEVFKFRRPNAFSSLMNAELPSMVAAEASEEWEKQGVGGGR